MLFANAFIALIFGILLLLFFFGYYGQELPNHRDLTEYEPPVLSRIYSSKGNLIDEFARERRIFISYEDMPVLVKQAFISAEDKNFNSHEGFDTIGIISAVYDAMKGKRLRGASTITQQVVKNFLLTSERSFARKIKELILSFRIEQSLSKEKIMELYLNEIFLGQGSYGVAAAAQHYFNKTIAELDLGEVAYLAGLPKAPSRYHPVRNYDRAIVRRNFVLREMYENGFIDKELYEATTFSELKTVQGGHISPFSTFLPPRDYFSDAIKSYLIAQFGADMFFTGGLSVRSTLDENLQREAKIALREGLETYDRAQGIWRVSRYHIAPEFLETRAKWQPLLSALDMPRDIKEWHIAVILEEKEAGFYIGIEDIPSADERYFIPKEDVSWVRAVSVDDNLNAHARAPSNPVRRGDVVYVKALFDNGEFRRWSLRQIPEVQGGFMVMDAHTGRVLAMQGGFSYENSAFNRVTQAKRQPGSVFKPFVYAAALDNGFTPSTIILDTPVEIKTFKGLWNPSNASKHFYDAVPLRIGIEKSRNLMTVHIAQKIGLDTIAKYAENFGIYDKMNPFFANVLGAQETTVFKIVSAYAMLANGGEYIQPTLVDRIQDRWGKTIFKHDSRICENCGDMALASGNALRITSDRVRVMDAITTHQIVMMLEGVVKRGTAARYIDLPIPIAGKTGTTNQAKDAWFIGFSSNIVAGCYIGFDLPKSLGEGASGGQLCAPVFNKFMQKTIEHYGGGSFNIPDGGVFVKMDRYLGIPLAEDSQGAYVVREFFREGTEPAYNSVYRNFVGE